MRETAGQCRPTNRTALLVVVGLVIFAVCFPALSECRRSRRSLNHGDGDGSSTDDDQGPPKVGSKKYHYEIEGGKVVRHHGRHHHEDKNKIHDIKKEGENQVAPVVNGANAGGNFPKVVGPANRQGQIVSQPAGANLPANAVPAAGSVTNNNVGQPGVSNVNLGGVQPKLAGGGNVKRMFVNRKVRKSKKRKILNKTKKGKKSKGKKKSSRRRRKGVRGRRKPGTHRLRQAKYFKPHQGRMVKHAKGRVVKQMRTKKLIGGNRGSSTNKLHRVTADVSRRSSASKERKSGEKVTAATATGGKATAKLKSHQQKSPKKAKSKERRSAQPIQHAPKPQKKPRHERIKEANANNFADLPISESVSAVCSDGDSDSYEISALK